MEYRRKRTTNSKREFHKRFRRWIRWWCNDKSRNRLRSSGSLRVSSPPPRVLIFLHRKPSTTVHLHGITSLLVTFPFVAKKIGTLQMNFTAYSANWDAVIFSLEILGQSEPVFIASQTLPVGNFTWKRWNNGINDGFPFWVLGKSGKINSIFEKEHGLLPILWSIKM